MSLYKRSGIGRGGSLRLLWRFMTAVWRHGRGSGEETEEADPKRREEKEIGGIGGRKERASRDTRDTKSDGNGGGGGKFRKRHRGRRSGRREKPKKMTNQPDSARGGTKTARELRIPTVFDREKGLRRTDQRRAKNCTSSTC